jgi:hypothetical protein
VSFRRSVTSSHAGRTTSSPGSRIARNSMPQEHVASEFACGDERLCIKDVHPQHGHLRKHEQGRDGQVLALHRLPIRTLSSRFPGAAHRKPDSVPDFLGGFAITIAAGRLAPASLVADTPSARSRVGRSCEQILRRHPGERHRPPRRTFCPLPKSWSLSADRPDRSRSVVSRTSPPRRGRSLWCCPTAEALVTR